MRSPHPLTFIESSVQACQFPRHNAVLSSKVSTWWSVVILQICSWVKLIVAGCHGCQSIICSLSFHPITFPLLASLMVGLQVHLSYIPAVNVRALLCVSCLGLLSFKSRDRHPDHLGVPCFYLIAFVFLSCFLP